MALPADHERGSATVWMLALSGVLAVVGIAAVLVGAAAVARHRAGSAADLAALAAAGQAVTGGPAACTTAADIAAANGAELTACTVDEAAVVEVAVRVPVRLGGLGVRWATARARAGPVPSDPVTPPRCRMDQKTRSSSTSPTGSCKVPAVLSGRGRSFPNLAADGSWRGSASTAAASSSRTTSSTRTAPALSSGSLPLPHLGDCTHDGHPLSHSQVATVARVACSHWRSTANPRSLKPAPPGCPS
jgi:secretion/DNA translocation related TadE-like protein